MGLFVDGQNTGMQILCDPSLAWHMRRRTGPGKVRAMLHVKMDQYVNLVTGSEPASPKDYSTHKGLMPT